MRRTHPRLGASFGDVMLLVAAAILVAALVYPGFDARAYDGHIERVFAEVEAARAEAEAARDDLGTWPASADLPALTGASRTDTDPAEGAASTSPTEYRLEWRRVALADLDAPSDEAAVDVPEEGVADADPALAPPRASLEYVGLLSVHTADVGTLQALLERYGQARSFVYDTVWTLILPRMSEPSDPAP